MNHRVVLVVQASRLPPAQPALVHQPATCQFEEIQPQKEIKGRRDACTTTNPQDRRGNDCGAGVSPAPGAASPYASACHLPV